jgi:hypothetical protein
MAGITGLRAVGFENVWRHPRSFFEMSLSSRAATRGFVGRRFFGGVAARLTSATSRACAASRFCGWERWTRLSTTSTPSVVTCLPASAISRSFTSGGRDNLPISTRNSTAVATLLTFWPPGPDARTKRSSITRSSRTMVSLTRIMGLLDVPVTESCAFLTEIGDGTS